MNQFLQTWHSRKYRRKGSNLDGTTARCIPDDLREMVKVTRKYGVRLKAVHPAQGVTHSLPAIWNVQTKQTEQPDTLCNKYGKCIRDKHNMKTMGDIAILAENLPLRHRRNKKCKCTKCEEIRRDTGGKCKHPKKCIERVTRLLGTIKEKWSPTSSQPAEFFSNPTPEEVGPNFNPDTCWNFWINELVKFQVS